MVSFIPQVVHHSSKGMKTSKTKKTAKATATISTPVPDAEAERRLRPVLDALHSHSHKQALKIVAQLLQKRPGWPAARALRSCVYLQMERWDEAAQEIDILREDLKQGRVPVCEDTAAKMHMYYKKIRREDVSAEIYEHAWRENPSEIGLAETAFCLYIRGEAFDDAQKLAMKLQRLSLSSTKNYSFWIAAAIWLGLMRRYQRLSQSESPLDLRLLKLSCAMMSEALKTRSPPPAEIVRFATRVYRQANDFKAAIKLISHPDLVMNIPERLHIRADLSFNSSKDCEDYRVLLSQYSPNDWEYWLRYFDSISSSEGDWIEKAKEFVESVLTGIEDSREPARGPHLALLELHVRGNNWNGLVQAVVDYFRAFGNKAVVASDLRPYIVLLQQRDLHVVVCQEIEAFALEKGFPYHMHACWLLVWLGILNEHPKELVQRYSEVKIDDLEATERQPGDDYVIIAAHKLLPVTTGPEKRLNNTVMVLKTILLFEAALSSSPFNHDFKLILLRLYAAVGGMERMFELWESLNVKHIQLATLSHFVIRPLFNSGHHVFLQETVDRVNELWGEIDGQIPDCITQAFLAGSINSAVDFVHFRRRLEQSSILADAMIVDAQLNIFMTNGEPIGVNRALSVLTMHPRFTISDFMGSGVKHLVTNEDEACFKFWDFQPYNPQSRLENMDEEVVREGTNYDPELVKSLAINLVSLLALLQLTDENSQEDGADEGCKYNINIPNELCGSDEVKSISPTLRLRFNIARNLLDVKKVLKNMLSASGQANGNADIEMTSQIERAVDEGSNCAAAILENVNLIVGNEAQGLETQLHFARALSECGELVFDLMLLVAVTLSSFGRVLGKAKRKAKKCGTKGEAKSSLAGSYESCRRIVLGFRDALLEATNRIQEWLTSNVERSVDWPQATLGHIDMLDVLEVLPDDVWHVRLEDGSRMTPDPISQEEFCKGILDSIQCSHSLSCKTLIETLTTITNRLRLADL